MKSLFEHALPLALTLASSALAGEPTHSLIFSPKNGAGYDRSLSGSAGTVLAELRGRDLTVITPEAGASAELIVPNAAINLMHGDRNVDGSLYEIPPSTYIDAATLCPRAGDPHMYEIYLSFYAPVSGGAGLPTIEPGDVVSLRSGGSHQALIRQAMIVAGLGITDPPVNVDAFAVLLDGSIVMSFEDDHMLVGGVPLEDGAIAFIPGAELTYSGCTVTGVTPASGGICLSEAQVDFMVANSGVADANGNAETTIGDVNALSFDVEGHGAGLVVQLQEGTYQIPDLIFSGDTLTGAGVLSTALSGSIARMNGVDLASAFPAATDGSQMGLAPGATTMGPLPNVRTISALAVIPDDPDPVRLVSDVGNGLPGADPTLDVHWGGALPGETIGLRLAVDAVLGTAPTSASIPNPGFGYYVSPAAPSVFVTLISDADGFGTLSMANPFVGGLGDELIWQPLAKRPGVGLIVGAPSFMSL